MRAFLTRLRALFRRTRLERDLDDEVAAHLDLLARDYAARGMSPAAARAAARRAFGGIEQMKEQYRDRRSLPMIETTLQDLRYALRTLRKSPIFTIVAILSIALGIGANTAIFTLLDQVILRLLPVRNPRQLVLVSAAGKQYGPGRGQGNELSYPRYAELRDHNDVFENMGARSEDLVQVHAGGRADSVTAELISGTYFPTLGVEPALGRLFGPADDDPAASHAIVVLTHAYWQSRFGADPGILGQSIVVSNHPLTVIGVTQQGFEGTTIGGTASMFVPLRMIELMPRPDALTSRRFRWLSVFARLRPGVTAEEAQARLQPFYTSQLQFEISEASFAKASAATKAAFVKGTVDVSPAGSGKSPLRTMLKRPLWILMTIVSCVLLIACANVANLLLARAGTRQREIALRLTLGATRLRIVRQLLIESLVLSLAGGVAGLAIAAWGSRALLAIFRDANPGLTVSGSPDLRVLLFTLALSILTGVLFGIVPARQGTRPALAPTLKNEAGSVIGGGSGSVRRALVVAQVALSLLLLIGAGLFIRSLHNLLTMDTGFQGARLLSLDLAPGRNGYKDERAAQFRDMVLARIRATPGVEAAGISAFPLLLGMSWNDAITVEGQTRTTGSIPFALENTVSPGWFDTVGMRIIAGRDFDDRDLQTGVPDRDKTFKLAIVNQTFARRYLQGGPAIGRHIGIGADPGTPTPIEIVGVVSDAKYTSLRDETQPQVFYPLTGSDFLLIYLRTSGPPEPMQQTMRQLLGQIAPDLAIGAMQTFDTRVARSLVTERMVGGLSTVFSLLATVLAMIGLYGVMAYGVVQRTREIGVRLAMGAQTREILWLVLRDAALLVTVGIAIGLPAAWFASRYIQAQLYGVQPTDPAVMVAAVLGLTLVATAAGLIPASRATRVNPVIALRHD